MPVSTVSRNASSLATGSTPGIPRHTGQTLVLGGAPNALAQPHHIFDFVLSWTWVSRPMTASYSINCTESLATDEHRCTRIFFGHERTQRTQRDCHDH